MQNISNKYLRYAVDIFLILLGTFIMGAAYNLFYASSGIILGGFGGIATIISDLFARINVNIPFTLIYLILNLILYSFAAKILGMRFAIYALFGIVGYSLSLELCKFAPISSGDLLLSSIYGGILTGIGIGMIVRVGGSTGGGDMLGCIINYKFPKISVGWVTIAVNALVIFIALFIYGINLTLYALIAVFISGAMSDLLIEGPKSVKAYYIISKKSKEVSSRILNELHRGATTLEGYGQYSGDYVPVIMCLVSGFQVSKLKQIVYEVDKEAFLFSVPVKESMGKGFAKLEQKRPYLLKSKKVVSQANVEKLDNGTLLPNQISMEKLLSEQKEQKAKENPKKEETNKTEEINKNNKKVNKKKTTSKKSVTKEKKTKVDKSKIKKEEK